MTAAADPAAMLARGYAVLHQLGHITITVGELDVPAIIDRETCTVHVQRGLDLIDFVLIMQAGVDALCRGATVVERDDGEGGTAWAHAVGAEYVAACEAEPPRPPLRLV
jgi:predicted RecB family endonuclease